MPRPRSDGPYACGPYKHRNRWRIVVYTPRADGGRDRTVQSCDTKQEAETVIRGFATITAARGRTIAEAVAEYVASLERKGNKPGSIKTATYRLDAILDQSRSLIDLTPRRAQDWYDELVDEGGATDTHRGCLVAAKAFGRFVESKKWLRANPFADIEPVGRKSRGKAQLGIDDARTFRAYCLETWLTKRDRSAVAAWLPLEQGLRAGEVAQLMAPHVDDKGRLLHVGEVDSKTEAGRRLLKVGHKLIEPLRALASSPATPEGHLFAKEDGTPADRHWVSWHARRHMKAAGVKVVTTHGLRGTFATLKDIEGSDRRATAKAMGHTTPTMTEAHYIDPTAAAAAAVDRVSAVLDDE